MSKVPQKPGMHVKLAEVYENVGAVMFPLEE